MKEFEFERCKAVFRAPIATPIRSADRELRRPSDWCIGGTTISIAIGCRLCDCSVINWKSSTSHGTSKKYYKPKLDETRLVRQEACIFLERGSPKVGENKKYHKPTLDEARLIRQEACIFLERSNTKSKERARSMSPFSEADLLFMTLGQEHKICRLSPQSKDQMHFRCLGLN